ncbi:hypothetical protein DPMN_080970 [Dreissena polymorpha]|uniref:Uncharacterized protein n=1 Tax=Dreissena polymorpha TaxID=45954 RepID=A0A9D3Y5K0_DREPO|nr:hypothetical protein DPMN_080970 [Dreissena polymorpha]
MHSFHAATAAFKSPRLSTASILANIVSPDQTPSQNLRVTQCLWQADEPVMNDFGFLPICPTTPVSVNESYCLCKTGHWKLNRLNLGASNAPMWLKS